MSYFEVKPKRVCVNTYPGVWALGYLKHITINGKYVVHLDGECAEHEWEADDVEFLEDAN